MSRLKHAVTGVVVVVEDGKAGRLPREWQPAEPAPRQETVRRARRRRKSN